MDKQKYSDAVDYLNDQYAYFLTHILNIGNPRSDYSIPTAGVQVELKEKDMSKFEFVFNPDFEEALNTEAYAFVLAHETLHVLLNHLKLAKKFPDHAKFNIAADCVINDYLESCGLELPPGLFSGEANVGYNCANSSVTQVYNDLPDDIVQKGGVGIQIDDHTWIHLPDGFEADKIMDAIEKAVAGVPMPGDLQDIKDDTDQKSLIDKMFKSQLAGTGVGARTAFTEDTGVSLNWAKLLEKIDPDAFKDWRGDPERPAWHKKPRKLGGFPDLYLPVYQKSNVSDYGERKLVFMALDTSGSIGPRTANYFVNLARSVTKTRIKLHVVTFTTTIQKLDLEKPKFNSGGTAFGIIEKYIQETVIPENKNKYPASVVVITDGYAGFRDYRMPEDKYKDRWYWLMIEGCRNSSGFGHEEKLSTYTGDTRNY